MKPSKAVGKVRLAIGRLASEEPFLTGILSTWRVVEDEGVKSMAVGFKGGRLCLALNPSWVESLTLDETQAVVAHEVLHVCLGHLDEDERARLPRNAPRTVAEEVTVNALVPDSLPLPGQPILLKDFPTLPENEGTDERYARLCPLIPDEADAVVTLDDHSRWDQVAAAGALASVVIGATVAEAWNKLSPEQKAAVPEALREQAQKAGSGSAGASQALGQGKASVDWRTALRRYVGKSLNRRPVFSRPPRRFPDLVGMIPGRARQAGKPKVLACIDCSGSMTARMLTAISGELAVMARTHEVVVAEFDVRVHDVYPYRPVATVHGRGGTSFVPLFEPSFLVAQRPDLVVVFTDGFGRAPNEPPRVPLIWCLTAKGKRPVAWGREVRMA